MNNATYWLHFRTVRPGEYFWEVRDDDGRVTTFEEHAAAIEWLEKSGALYYDTTE